MSPIADDSPNWSKLIYGWVKGKGRHGLTFPYIIGASTILKETVISEHDARTLFNEVIASNNPPFVPIIFYCNEIRTYVIGICDAPDYEDYPLSVKNAQGETTLYCRQDFRKEYIKNNLNIEEQIFEGLMQAGALEAIKKQRFSWNRKNREWVPYSKENREFIEQIIS